MIQRCLEHICTTVKITYEEVLKGHVYFSLLILNLLAICEGDKILLLEGTLETVLSRLLGRDGLSPPLEATTLIDRIVYTQLDKKALLHLCPPASGRLTPLPPSGISYSGVLDGLALSSLRRLEDLSLQVVLPALHLIIDLVNGDPASFGSCHSLLLEGAKAQALARCRPECPPPGLERGGGGGSCHEPLRELLGQCLADLRWTHMQDLISHEALLVASCRWILAAHIQRQRGASPEVTRYLQQCTDPTELEEFAEAVKIVDKLVEHPPPIPKEAVWPATWPAAGLVNLHPSPTALLYLAERAGLDDHQAPYGGLYQDLDADYAHYFATKRRDGFLLSINGPSEEAATWKEVYAECARSWLICQKWDVDDIPKDFDPISNPDDRLYQQLRQTLPPHSPDLLQSASPAARIACLTCAPNWDRRMLIDQAFKAWTEVGKASPTREGARILRAVDCAAQRDPSGLTLALADMLKSEVLWKLGQQDQAALLAAETAAKPVLSDLPGPVQAWALLRTAKYSWRSKSCSISHIRRRYLDRIPVDGLPEELRAKSFYVMASFYDEQYQRLVESESLQMRRRLVRDSQRDLSRLRHLAERSGTSDNSSSAYEKARRQLEDHIAQDRLEIDNMLLEREQYALRAADHYQRAMVSGEKYAWTMFRLCSLWFSHRQSPQMDAILRRGDFPIRNLLPLMYQLVARLDHNQVGSHREQEQRFQSTLQDLLLQVLLSHPLHCIYQLLAVKTAGREGTASAAGGPKRKLVGGESSTPGGGRGEAAARVISKAQSGSDALRLLIADVGRLSGAYTELALHRIALKTSTKVAHPFDPAWSIGAIKSLACPVPTLSLEGERYGPWEQTLDRLPKVLSFDPEGYRVVGGINMPKIVVCQASDGKKYRQLVKGHDDVRQVPHHPNPCHPSLTPMSIGCCDGTSVHPPQPNPLKSSRNAQTRPPATDVPSGPSTAAGRRHRMDQRRAAHWRLSESSPRAPPSPRSLPPGGAKYHEGRV